MLVTRYVRGTRLDDLGETVVDAAAKEVGADNDIIVSRHASQHFLGLLGHVHAVIDEHRKIVDVVASAREQSTSP